MLAWGRLVICKPHHSSHSTRLRLTRKLCESALQACVFSLPFSLLSSSSRGIFHAADLYTYAHHFAKCRRRHRLARLPCLLFFLPFRFPFPFCLLCRPRFAYRSVQSPRYIHLPPPPNTTRRCHGPIMSCHSILSGGQWNIGAHIDATLHTNLPDLCVSFPGREACRRRQRAMRRTRLKRPRPFSGFNGREPFAGSSPRLSTDQRNNSWHATEYQGEGGDSFEPEAFIPSAPLTPYFMSLP